MPIIGFTPKDLAIDLDSKEGLIKFACQGPLWINSGHCAPACDGARFDAPYEPAASRSARHNAGAQTHGRSRRDSCGRKRHDGCPVSAAVTGYASLVLHVKCASRYFSNDPYIHSHVTSSS